MPNHDNPVMAARAALGLSAWELAVLMGCGYAEVRAAETGYRACVPEKVLAGLERLGHDSGEVARQYQAWREELGQEIAERTAGGGK